MSAANLEISDAAITTPISKKLGCCVKQKTECNRLQTNCLPTVVLTQSSPVCTIVFHKVVNVAQSLLSQLV